jgi:hypothetical protein
MQEAAHLISMVLGRGEFKGKRILSQESVEEMIRVQEAGNLLDQGNAMALGFRASFEELKDGRAPLLQLGHGGMARHRSTLEFFPAWNVGFIAGVNDYNARNGILWGTGETLLKGVFALRGETYGYAKPLARTAQAARDLSGLAGEYASIYGYRLLKLGADGALALEAPGTVGPEHPELIPQADGQFAMDMGKDPALVFHFEKDAGGAVTGAVLREKGLVVNHMQKLPPAELPSAWAERAGVYEPVGDEDKARTGIPAIHVLRQGGRLLVKAALTPANREDLGRFYANVLFPLRFLDDAKAEVVNGALSGFEGYVFSFQKTGDGVQLGLQDSSGTAGYSLKK